MPPRSCVWPAPPASSLTPRRLLAVEDPHQDHAQNDRDDEQSEGDGSAASELEELERYFEEIDREDFGGVTGAAAGQYQGGVDETEIVHEAQQDGDEQHRVEIGQG